MFVIDVKNLDVMLIIVQILRNHNIMLLYVATSKHQGIP